MTSNQDLDKFFKELDEIDSKSVSITENESQKKKKSEIEYENIDFEVIKVGVYEQFDVIPLSLKKTIIPLEGSNSEFYSFPDENALSKSELIAELESSYFDYRKQVFRGEKLNSNQLFWPRQVFQNENEDLSCLSNELFQMDVSAPRTTLEIVIDGTSGHVKDFKEVNLTSFSSTPFNSTSLDRPLGNPDEFHRGSTENQPFMPGGLDSPTPNKKIRVPLDDFSLDFSQESNLLSRPPGFDYSISFERKEERDFGFEMEKWKERSGQIVSNPIDLIAPYTAIEDMHDERLIERKRDQFKSQLESKKQQVLSFRSIYADEDDDEDGDLNAELENQVEELENLNGKEEEPDAYSNLNDVKEKTLEDESLEELLAIETSFNNFLASGKKRNTNDPTQDWAVMESIDVSDFNEMVPEMAIDYPFDLDGFQKEAVIHLERGESVFIGAHTSAGKTVVAEYAIALAAKHMTRAIYTSPIKALSNQKFRDFKSTFGDVGLITGDVQIKPEASCLILTTEILRSMLYRGADLIRDVEWVIFDEVHYVNDLDRGVVWEEVIIMLPAHVNIILLSATVPNTFEFADWVGRTKKKKIWVISTMKRPVPLEHYLYSSGEVHKIVDNKGSFLAGGYRSATAAMKEKSKTKIVSGAAKHKSQQGEWSKLVNHLKAKNLLPVVVFAFSKKKCEECAYGLSGVDLTTGTEKAQIHIFVEESVSRLKGSDKRLPQVMKIKEILKRGVGVHHGGLLPIIKEIVEILFSRGLVKVLFATETFAMGVNMPTRTVVFNSIRKHDGRNFRELLSGEYIQMSGRAGRRGLDTVGTVLIACWEEIPEASTLTTMILGKATRLESQFRLTYNMILNLLRVEDFKVEDMIKRSFSEVSTQKLLPEQKSMLSRAENVMKKLAPIDCIFGEPDIENFHSLHSECRKIEQDLQKTIMSSRQGVQSLVAGRLVIVNTDKYLNCIAVVIKMNGDTSKGYMGGDQKDNRTVKVLILIDKSEEKSIQKSVAAINPKINQGGDGEIVDISLGGITRICKEKLKFDVGKMEKGDQVTIKTVTQQLIRIIEENPFGPLEIDATKELKINDLEFGEKNSRKNNLSKKMTISKCHQCPKLPEQYALMSRYSKIRSKVNVLKFALSDDNLQLMPEFQTRLGILQRLNYIDADKTVLIKGRVAREINTVTDELIATELVFENVLTPLSPAEIVALLSCLIFEEKTEYEPPALSPTLEGAKERIIGIATGLANIQIESGLLITVGEYVKNLKFGMMEVVYEWARQMPFSDIALLTEIQEGSIVRCIVRLDETCKEVRNAARIIGDTALFSKMEQASQLIKRDIVFASSLYVS
eukprot:TRINITY_DN1455_c0_g4_i1.p1 TRINITY_DN1455_c0_g4~~TRINITY_DN1455_c0_g4_i1.p1  ORF type:complete len:1331 (-),score=569.99 TRINITY_DN1455_c0_g4_i1:196-4188(-)